MSSALGGGTRLSSSQTSRAVSSKIRAPAFIHQDMHLQVLSTYVELDRDECPNVSVSHPGCRTSHSLMRRQSVCLITTDLAMISRDGGTNVSEAAWKVFHVPPN